MQSRIEGTEASFVLASVNNKNRGTGVDYKPISMNIGILKETGRLERRVALSPAGVHALVVVGHTVHVERLAGAAALFTDEEYITAGGVTAYSGEEIINKSELVLKISPPSEKELQQLSKGQAIFSFLNLAISRRKEIEALLQREVTALAYEDSSKMPGAN